MATGSYKMLDSPNILLSSYYGGAVQNNSANLTCHTDANPGVKRVWFRVNQTLVGEELQLFFRSPRAASLLL